MEFRILGQLEIVEGDRPVALVAAKQRALLALLLLHANEVVSADRLIDELWGEHPPDTARTALQVYVSKLRKALGQGDLLQTRSAGYFLPLAPEQLDRDRFERLYSDGRETLRSGEPELAAAELRRALSLWRGPALADFRYEPFAQTEIARLEELRLAALEDRIDAEIALGADGGLVAELEAHTSEYPLRERPRGQLMLALYRGGRQAEALELYRNTRARLREELGLDPSSELKRLQQAILRQDPSLEQRPGVPRPRSVRVRKLVTVLRCELSVEGPEPDPEVRERLLEPAFAQASEIVARHGGTLEGALGDVLVAAFGTRVAHEDDALRALRAAAELRETVRKLNKQYAPGLARRLAVRSAASTGEVIADRGRPVAGGPVTASGRLQHACAWGEIALDEATRRLAAGAIEVTASEQDWRLVEVRERAAALARRLDAPMVGREAELRALRDALARAMSERTPALVTVLGEAGIGKTRLAQELCAEVTGEAQTLVGSCLSYGEGITFWPLREILVSGLGETWDELVRELFRGDQHAELLLAQLEAAVGANGTDGRRDEIFWATRRLFEALARDRPLLVLLEDLHWSAPTFLDLVEQLAETTSAVPLLVLCLARRELLDERPSWPGAIVRLHRLDDGAVEALLDNLVGRSPLAPETRARVKLAAEGNPLFLEQLVALLAERASGAAELATPPTIQALLAARLDRLGPAERAVLERAAIVGRDFSRLAVVALLPEAVLPSADRHLRALVRKELVEIAPERFDDHHFRFRHVLVQEAAYRSTAKALRAELHEQHGGWLEETSAGSDHEDFIGHHLEQAYLQRAELGELDARTARLAERAGGLLAEAGRRAYARFDEPGAIGLYDRAASLLPPRHPGRLRMLPDFAEAEAVHNAGDAPRADRILSDAVTAAAESGDRGIELWARARRAFQRETSSPQDVIRLAEEAVVVLEELGDDAGLARVWKIVSEECSEGIDQQGVAERADELALEHARLAGDRRLEAEALIALASAAWWGRTPVNKGIQRCQRLLKSAGTNRRVIAAVSLRLACLQAGVGRFDEARRLLVEAKEVYVELGLDLPPYAVGLGLAVADVELLAGDFQAAERALRPVVRRLDELGVSLATRVWAPCSLTR